MRVRLYWSIARLAHAEGRESVALTNVRKAIALLQATDDTFHLAPRTHPRCRHHARARRRRRSRAAPRPGRALSRHVDRRRRTARDHDRSAPASRLLRGEAENAAALATRGARAQPATTPPVDQRYRARRARATALALAGDVAGSRRRVRPRPSTLLEATGPLARRATAALPRVGPHAARQRPRDARRSTCSTAPPSSACARRPTAAHVER